MKTSFNQVRTAMAYAARHLDQDVSLNALAEHTAMSPFHLHRVFADIADETPKRFTSRLRLGRAAALLLTTQESVLQIALGCGFDSHEGFTRAFRRRFGITPSAYRARGFAARATAKEESTHQELVHRIAPCVKFFHIQQNGNRPRKHMTYSIATKEVSPQPVLVERHRVSRSEIAATIGQVVPRLFEFAQHEGIALTGNPFTRYLDAGPGLLTIEPGMRVASSEAVESADSDAEGVRRDTLPGGSVVCTVHAGSYETLHQAYAAIEAWIESEGLVAAGAPWESYLTDPTAHPDPKDWKTEVCWPVA